MTPGDIPCNAECHNILCRYCAFGMCTDNAPCEDRLPMPEPKDNDENTQED